jgi:hypothetical protein
VFLLHARLVFVTKYRRPAFTDALLTLCEHKAAAHGLATPISEVVAPLRTAASDGPG